MKDTAVQEMIRAAILPGAADRKHMMRVLFLAKERLSDENPLKRRLAFYWGADGPHSDVIQANLDAMVSEGLVLKGDAARSAY